ncbi:MAG: 50S ribosomal protein L30e [Candidatus Marsarchaeota archaeon]|jgi:large subunit ribosomal protein L30e|nr:50S ribosomal protein L30e [Candidatus Marsarchaeota archaeon]MCL5115100.1 50S ribosomal protein L30e [Candidatus Marsarchaeota archaeon]
MAEISNDIRLAVDSGETAIGLKSVINSIKDGSAKLIIMASKNKKENASDITHIAGLAGIKMINFEGNPAELGAVCGKPFSVSTLSIIEPGNSNILKSDY